MRLRDVGWVWEGQGIDPGVYPSIFGVGEGAEYFGLSKVCYMFHPNTALAMRKLSHMDEVVCDISKWKFRWTKDGGAALYVDGAPSSVRWEAENVSRLSVEFPNITGAIHDDMRGLVKREDYAPEDYAPIYDALHSSNAKLKLWSVVYTHELNPEEWAGFTPYMDIINLWVWRASDLLNLDEYIERCRTIFPDKPIIMGCYLRDYPTQSAVPMDLLKFQWERVLHYIEKGLINGYSILATILIEVHEEQAKWVRDFIAAN